MSDNTRPTTESAAQNPPPRKRGRKFLRVTIVTIVSIVSIVVIALATTTTINAIATASEAKEIRKYGRLVDVDGKKMNVDIQGAGAQTIVLLPGFGTGSPVIDFAPLVDKLKANYRTVVVEPFGYGLSDETDRPRTNANIAREVHSALQALHIDRYVLGGHSIAGIYGLQYVNTYRDEVTAFVGIDTSVPTQPGIDEELNVAGLRTLKTLGLVRVLTALGDDPYTGLPYTDAQKYQSKIISLRNGFTDTYADEMERFGSNFHDAQKLAFPKDLPLLLFVQSDNTDVEGWMTLHKEQAASVERSELIPLDADHYLHHTKSAEIASAMNAFLTAG
ncbi:alpha/beta fold hydrolase [Leifsonia sp. Le1]|uniref:alpha/beta fold hydrolase n=1 Tax=Leifsonia sp. Le1 TaxID=3404918 RepID=UPI003EBD8E44